MTLLAQNGTRAMNEALLNIITFKLEVLNVFNNGGSANPQVSRDVC
jgi:hypothetical protein